MGKKTGVLLMAFGGADSLDTVEPFMRNVLKKRPVTAEFIEKTKERYRVIGGKSPLLDITLAQAKGVEEILNREGDRYRVYVGMLNWKPFIKETLHRMRDDGITEAAAFIMSPFTSPVATGAYEKVLYDTLDEMGGALKVKLLINWHISPAFSEIIIGKIEKELKAFKKKEDALVIYSIHSLPREALEGDAYEMKIHQAVDEIKKRVNYDYRVAYQSQGTSALNWLGPRTDEVIEEAGKKGKKGVVVVPLGFVADHIETLYDIDILFKTTAETQGLVFRRTESLNTTLEFLELLADLVKTCGEIY